MYQWNKDVTIKNLQDQIRDANEVINFYAEHEGLSDLAYDQDGEPLGYINKDDIDLIPTSHETVDIVHGKRARAYVEKYGV